MRILVTGATGFIGRHLTHALQLAGHSIIVAARNIAATGRHFPIAEYIAVDFTHDVEPAAWLPRLDGIDAVINAVGIFRESDTQRFDALHVRGPCALFTACAEMGGIRVVQISALGAQPDAPTPFLRSKWAADDYLLRLPLSAVVVQPSLVFGSDGASSRFFARLAALPVLPLPDGGAQCVQPIHIDDLVAGIVRMLALETRGRIAAVGPQPLALRNYLAQLREQLGYDGASRVVPLPARRLLPLVRAVPTPWLDADALHMLSAGNCSDPHDFERVLGRPARPPAAFVTEPARWHRAIALDTALPLLRGSIAVLWIVTGALSLGIYPVADSLELLARSGVPPALREMALHGAAILDIALGCAVLLRRLLPAAWRRWLWPAQALLIFVYTAIISWKLPEFWLHPYAPILKNIPLLAALGVLQACEDRRR